MRSGEKAIFELGRLVHYHYAIPAYQRLGSADGAWSHLVGGPCTDDARSDCHGDCGFVNASLLNFYSISFCRSAC